MKNSENEKILRKVFGLGDIDINHTHFHLFEDIELEPLSDLLKEEINKFDEMVNFCLLYSSGKDKEAYKLYNLGASTDIVKRFSNKLEDRHASVQFPFEIIKNIFIATKEKLPNNTLGLIMGAIYECFKLKKLSSFSSMKKNYEDEAIDNIYLRILNESFEKKDFLANNLCKFLFSELGGGVLQPKIKGGHKRNFSESPSPTGKRSSVLNCEGSLGKKDEDAADFVTGKRNNKYILLEIFSNVLFHSTEVFQEYIYEMIQKPEPMEEDLVDAESLAEAEKGKEVKGGVKYEKMNTDMKMLDIIWKELLLNFSFSYYRTRQDRLWKEYFMRTILLIKFHQYLCEENNAKFKKVFKNCFVDTIVGPAKEDGSHIQKDSRYTHINNLMGKFWFRSDWGKKNYILIKRGFMFPVAQALFDFLTESMCGPYYDNQYIITNKIHFKLLSSFLDTFEPAVHEMVVGKKSKDELVYHMDTIRNVNPIDVNQMNEFKLSLCDFLLICCEGHNEVIIENQLKRINSNELLETVVKLVKALTFKFSNKNKITYDAYKTMKSAYKSSGFNEDQTMFLEMALKLYMYLKILADYNNMLKHLLENKEEIATKVIKENKKIKIGTSNCCKRKKIVVDDDENDEEIDLTDFEDGLCLRFLGSFAKRLEILTGDPELEQEQKEFLFFEPNPKFSYLSQETKDEFIEMVDRTSHESKLHGLITACTYFEEEINITEKIKQKHPKMSKLFSSYKEYEIGLFLGCCIINLLILINNDVKSNGESEDSLETPEKTYDLPIRFLGAILCAFSSFCFIIWIWIRFPIEKKLNVLRYCESKGVRISQIKIFTLFQIICETIFNENLVRVLLLHVVCTILGLSISQGNGFYAIQILSIVNLFGTFKYLAKSISLHWHQLLFTLFMVLILIYIYSVFADIFFQGNLAPGFRTSLIHCYFAMLNTGFTNGMGIGGMLEPEQLTQDNAPRYFGYVLIDLLFFISVNCISLNLVFGIIVDTFGELREQNEKYGYFLIFIRF